MDKDFDKEIDAILRNAAKGNTFAESPKNHLDADEISLFAEDALPINARTIAIEHFADCNRCRSILVDVAAFNQADLEIPNVNVIEKEASFLASFKNWFSLPQIGFAMGALTLLFVGIIGYIALKNNQQESAQLEEKSKVTSEAKSANMNQPVSNKIQNANAASSATNIVTANALSNTQIAKATNIAPNSVINSASKPVVSSSPSSPEAKSKREEKSVANAASGATSSDLNDKVIAEASPKSLPENDTKNGDIQPSPAINNRTQDSIKDEEVTRSAPGLPTKKQASSNTETKLSGLSANKTRSIVGKTFRNEKGVWIDSAYKGGTLKNVSKGTNDFKKLDSGLRNIANNFTETVIVVWKTKAYQIQ